MPAEQEVALDVLLESCQDTSMAFSASRILAWMRCNRLAGWEYICGYRAEGTGATDKGSAVHAVLESLRKDGLLPDRTDEIGAIAAEALPYLPDREEGEKVEAYFSFQPGRHEWCGYKDLEIPGLVIDYKTTSDFKYAKTAEDLPYDPQAILYAHHYFTCHPDASTVDLCWLYLKSRKPYEARPVTLTMTREWAAQGFAALESYADEMAAAVAAAPTDVVDKHKYVLTLLPNEEQCDAFRGCPHQARCNISMFRDRNRKVPNVNLLERLQQLTGGTPVPLAPPAPAPLVPTNTVAAIMPNGAVAVAPGVDPLFAELQASLNRPDFAALNAASPVVPTQGNPHPLGADLDQPAVDAVVAAAEGINPPKRGRGRPKKDTIPAPALTYAPGPRQAISLSPPPALEPSPEVATVAQQAPPALSPKHEPADVDVAKALIDTISASRAKKIGTLYVGCIPVGVPCENLDDMLLKAREMIGQAAYFGGYGYKTNGMVSEAINKMIDALAKPISDLIVADPRLPEAALVLSYLRANAGTVIEALR
jgi:hypothetical protein